MTYKETKTSWEPCKKNTFIILNQRHGQPKSLLPFMCHKYQLIQLFSNWDFWNWAMRIFLFPFPPHWKIKFLDNIEKNLKKIYIYYKIIFLYIYIIKNIIYIVMLIFNQMLCLISKLFVIYLCFYNKKNRKLSLVIKPTYYLPQHYTFIEFF